MTYKDSDQRTKDYLGKFTKDKVVQNLIGTDKPIILDTVSYTHLTLPTTR